MKKFLRWCIYILVVLLLLGVAAIFSINRVAKSVAEKRIADETGMKTEIGKFDISFVDRSIHIENFKLINPPQFGGGTFLSLPELFVELDADKIREQNKLYFKSVRVDLAEMNIVEDKNGRSNVDQWHKPPSRPPSESPKNPPPASTNEIRQTGFGGIDHLEISLGHVRFSSERDPTANFDRDLGIRKRTFNDIKTEQQLQAIGVILAAQSGINIFQQSRTGSADGSKASAAKVLQDIFAPFQKSPGK